VALPSALPSIRHYTDALTVADVAPKQLVVDEKGTICSPAAKKELDRSPALIVVSGRGQESEILVKRELNHGGMGVILLAEQSSLGREVAVKVANEGKDSAGLVVEARVAGQLEHPNIVPVHLLGQSADGKPLIVMKRIEGESWQRLMAERKDLARDIDILMDVCRALHYAHAHGVVHRDVKPANVMVGRFGEVYLLDWGVAVAFDERSPPDVPRAKGVAGTPRYMAPEMATPGVTIDQRSDVYLVGAVLHELLTGSAPHARGSVEQSLFAAHVAAEPTFAEGSPVGAGATTLDGEPREQVPEELAAICTKAMKRDPAERYQSADDVRHALARFQSHAAARALCDDAERGLAQLRALPADADAREVQRAFGECRFGFAHALRAWPESSRAKNGFIAAIEHMARREIAAGHLDSASLLVGEIDVVDPSLSAALDELRASKEREAANVKQLEKFAADHDLHIAERERALFVFGSGIGWLVLLLFLAELDRRDIFHAAGGTFALVMAVIVAFLGVSALVFRDSQKNAASRVLFGTIVVGALAILAVHAAGFMFDVPAAPILAVGDTVLATTIATVALSDRRLWPSAVLAALIAPAIVLLPSQAYVVSGLGSFFALGVAAFILRRGTK
jgi:serine/threonine-protein kinase